MPRLQSVNVGGWGCKGQQLMGCETSASAHCIACGFVIRPHWIAHQYILCAVVKGNFDDHHDPYADDVMIRTKVVKKGCGAGRFSRDRKQRNAHRHAVASRYTGYYQNRQVQREEHVSIKPMTVSSSENWPLLETGPRCGSRTGDETSSEEALSILGKFKHYVSTQNQGYDASSENWPLAQEQNKALEKLLTSM